MNDTNFKEGLIIAFGLSVFGSLFYSSTNLFIGNENQIYSTLSMVSLFYIVYLIIRSNSKTGRITAVSLWIVITISSWFAAIPFSIFIMLQLVIIWILRCLYFHSSIFSSIADLLLTIISFSAAIWAGFHSGSLFLALWSLFLIQSLFVFIPISLNKHSQQNIDSTLFNTNYNSDFDRAYHCAKQALGKLAE